MGHKVHPGGLRVGIIHTWKSNWFTTSKDFSGYLSEDFKIRDHIYGKLSHAGLSDIHIRKDKQKVTVDIYTARPGIVIGKSGSEVDALRKELHDMTGKAVQVNITEIKRPELDAKLVAQSIAEQLQNRVSFRRAMKRSLSSSMRSGAQGVKIRCGGRLGGAEMSRTESYSEGRVPLHTLRADIDYGFAEAKTTFGRIGVKVWINKGEIMPEGFERDAAGTRLGEVDTRRRRGGRPGDAEQLGPARPQRRGGGGGGGGRDGAGRGRRPRQGQNDPAQSGDPNAGAGGRRARPRPQAAPAAPEAAAPETATPETAAPETAAPETATPEAAAPETAAPETTAPEAAAPETAAPETAAPETTAPEAAAFETAAPEAAAPEAAAPEAEAPEAAVTEAPAAETATEPAAAKKPARKPAAKKPAAKKPAAEKAAAEKAEQPAAEEAASKAPEGGDA
jgi:small subunit ribosomal protein S3